MNNLNQYIIEKLKVNSKSKISNYSTLDMHNTDMMLDVLKASFIGLLKQHFEHKKESFKQLGLSQYIIKRNNVDFENIVNVLNEYYNYNFDINEVNNKSDLYKTIKGYFQYLDKLINMKNVIIKSCGGEISGYKLYLDEWKEYIKKHNIRA